MSRPLRVIFMGTPQFAVPALEALVASKHDVIAVYSQPPRPAGRGQRTQQSPVHDCAERLGIPVFTPKSLKVIEAQDEFGMHQADVAVVAAYGLILPAKVLAMPKYGCINIHASLLPRWRGASPIQHAIWKGDAESGVTIMQMNEGLDTGDMLKKATVPISPETNCAVLHDVLSALGSGLIVEVLDSIEKLTPEKQDDAQSTYAPLLKKTDGKITWAQSAIEIDRQIRALNPWPGTYCNLGNKRIKILEAVPDAGAGVPGTVLNKIGHVACGQDVLKILKVQFDGGKPMGFTAALNGNAIKIGDVLS